jgi:hypothetical protein
LRTGTFLAGFAFCFDVELRGFHLNYIEVSKCTYLVSYLFTQINLLGFCIYNHPGRIAVDRDQFPSFPGQVNAGCSGDIIADNQVVGQIGKVDRHINAHGKIPVQVYDKPEA